MVQHAIKLLPWLVSLRRHHDRYYPRKIKAYKLEEVAADKAAKPIEAVEAEAKAAGPVRPFAGALRDAARTGYGLIAEIKRPAHPKG